MSNFISPEKQSTTLQFPNLREGVSISLVGMAGAGKTTVGRKIAAALGWAFTDTDFLIESTYGVPLQDIADAMSKDEFLNLESSVICTIRLNRCVISTGGSVVYREEGMAHLASLGPIIHLDVPFPIIEERIARNPDRGLAIAPGQTIHDLFLEREKLYQQYATASFNAAQKNPDECAQGIIQLLASL